MSKRHCNIPEEVMSQPFADVPLYTSREIDYSKIQVPLLSVGNLGNLGLHLAGNVDGYTRAGSKEKWLFFCGGRHDTTMFLPDALALQQSFRKSFPLYKL